MNELVLDLYAGAGGWAEGVGAVRPGPAVGLEWWLPACQTAQAAGHPRICCDVARYPTAPFAGRVAGLTASPPCQPWSAAGLRAGLYDQNQVHALVDAYAAGSDRAWLDMAWSDDRSHHAAQPMRWLYALRPEWCALEQVPAVLPLWQHIGRTLTEWGYSVWCGVLNAADYGVPQIRRRAILVASRARRVACPPATHYDVRRRGNGLFGAPWISMAEALGWGCEDRPSPTVTGGGTGSGGGVEVFAGRAARAAVAFRGSRRPHATLRELDEPAPTVVCSADRWTIDRPATTVQADPRISPPGHRDRAGGERQHQGSIRISVAQAALLQGFRADYPWRGSSTAQYAQIGNAVPPPLAADVIAVATGARLP